MDLANGRRTPRHSRRAGRDQKTEPETRAAASAAIEEDPRLERPKTNGPSVREVRILGLDHHPRGAAWSPGREVQWLGRDYVVIAAANRPCSKAAADDSLHYYVHLTDPDARPDHMDRGHERPGRRSAGQSSSSLRSAALAALEARGQ